MMETTYRGSLLFSPLADRLGLPLDQVNFLLSQLAGLAVGVLFRRRLHPATTAAATRHALSATVGICLLLLCYGRDTVHVVNQAAMTYLILRLVPAHSVHRVCLVATMLYLSRIHYMRLLVPKLYMDISGPVMVLTMKATLLACNVHDGSPACSETAKSKPNLQRIAVRRVPSLVEFLGYAFSFQNLLVGPMIDFHHYKHYIEHGASPTSDLQKHKMCDSDGNANVIERSCRPSERGLAAAVRRRLLVGAAGALSVLLLVPLVPHAKFKEAEYHTWPLARQWGYMYVAGMAARMKYYTAWTLAEAVCIMSGLGFSGTSETGEAQWNGADNVDIWKVECGGSFRESLAGWNLGTARWLRLVVYERTTRHRTAAVYVLSALWHGLHPCYYLAFSIGALCTQADRVGRRHLWPHCRDSAPLRRLYTVGAFVGARASLAYFHVAFELLDLPTSLRVYRDAYFSWHIICIAMMVLLPVLLPVQKSPSPPEVQRIVTPPSPNENNPHFGETTSADLTTSEVKVADLEPVTGDLLQRRRPWAVPEISSRALSGSVCSGTGTGSLATRAAKFHVM